MVKYQRKFIRLKDYDYSQAGGYFITICVHNHRMLLQPSPVQNMIKRWWDKLPQRFHEVEIDQFVIMPNHIHGVILIVGADPRVCPNPVVGADPRVCPNHNDKGEHMGSPLQNIHPSLSDIIQWFKTMTTNEYIHYVNQNDWLQFETRFWQRNYYEHIIRDESELNRICEYIINNPVKWQFDRENTDRIPDQQYEQEWQWLEGY